MIFLNSVVNRSRALFLHRSSSTKNRERLMRLQDEREKETKFSTAETKFLEAIMNVDRNKTYEVFGYPFITTYCMKRLGLSQDVAGNFVRVARKSLQVPELGEAIVQGDLTLSVAKA